MKPTTRRLIQLGILLVVIAALFGAWRWTPLGDRLSPEALAATAMRFREHPLAVPVSILAFVLGCVVLVPVSPMIVALSAAFGTLWGIFISMVGALGGAVPTFWIGRLMGKKAIDSLGSETLARFNQLLARRGIVAVALIRFVPVAPFSIVNIAVGASSITFRDYLIGTTIGMVPAVCGIALFGDRLTRAIREPGPMTIGILVAVGLVVFGGLAVLRRWLWKKVAAEADRKTGGF